MTNIGTSHYWRPPHLVFSCSSSFKLYDCWWKRKTDIISSTWTQWMKDSLHCLMWLFEKSICFWQLLGRWGTIRRILWKITSWHKKSFTRPFSGNIMKCNKLRFLHFYDNKKDCKKTDHSYDHLWQIKTISDKLNDLYATYYSPAEHFVVEIIVLLKNTVILNSM
jgi:hypothetical protein